MKQESNVQWLHELSKDQLDRVELHLFENEIDEAPVNFVKYLKQVPDARFEKIIERAKNSKNVYLVSEVIKCLRYRRCELESYDQLLREALKFRNDDFVDTVVLSAIWNLPERLFKDVAVRNRLEALSKSENPSVVEAIDEIVRRHDLSR